MMLMFEMFFVNVFGMVIDCFGIMWMVIVFKLM